ncbi:phage holin family protein [Aurantiacibacter marinus]|uniref:phage holin family protein n=1 Tax=Aurantiacibacter marinus TaxID=874156 RepID=UPI00069BC589|nr:phage holin family protein [Aurantiacibacter marinus]
MDADLSDHPFIDAPAVDLDEKSGSTAQRSLYDDVEALFTDARTYFDAELTYQKSRAGFVANRLKVTIACGIAAAFLAVLALIGLTMGMIIALTPLITAWGATAVVVFGILLIAYLFVRRAGKAWRDLTGVMSSSQEDAGQND